MTEYVLFTDYSQPNPMNVRLFHTRFFASRSASVLCLLVVLLLSALRPSLTSAQKDATPIIQKLMDKYEKVNALTSEIRLVIQLPEEESVEQKAVLYQRGKKFRLDSDQQRIVCDGTTIWTYTPEDNRVVLTNAEETDNSMNFNSPQGMLRELANQSQLMWVTDHIREGQRTITVIELKPKDLDSEFFKVKLHIYEPQLLLTQLQSFSKDGTKYTIFVDKSTINPQIDNRQFVFDPKAYPEIEIEDLRL